MKVLGKTKLNIADQNALLNQISNTYKDFYRASMEYAHSGVSGRQFRRHPDTKPVTSGHLIDSIFINIILDQ